MSEVANQLKALIPSSLDNIIRENRDKAEIRLTSEAEIASLATDIHGYEVKAVIDDWHFVSIVLLHEQGEKIMLLGNLRGDGNTFGSSKVLRIDLASNLVVTHNSVYGLGQKGVGEPDMHQLIFLCTQFHRLGLGEYFGVPHFFY